jgi:hypothetical protein
MQPPSRRSCTIHPRAAGQPCDPRRHPCRAFSVPGPRPCTPVPHSAAVSCRPDDTSRPELLVFEISLASRSHGRPQLALPVPSVHPRPLATPLHLSAPPAPLAFIPAAPLCFIHAFFPRCALYTKELAVPQPCTWPAPCAAAFFLAPSHPALCPLCGPLYTPPSPPAASQPL